MLRKCAVQASVPVAENHSNGYPVNIQLFRFEIRAFESLDSCLSASTHCSRVCARVSTWREKF